VERDEDLTGPYGFGDGSAWLAFDDSNSLKIKTKYALLRCCHDVVFGMLGLIFGVTRSQSYDRCI
jgi:hypothetical protein